MSERFKVVRDGGPPIGLILTVWSVFHKSASERSYANFGCFKISNQKIRILHIFGSNQMRFFFCIRYLTKFAAFHLTTIVNLTEKSAYSKMSFFAILTLSKNKVAGN